MYHLERDLIFEILHYLMENNCHESAQKLEQESKVYFNTTRFTGMVLHGKWSDVDEYLRSFTRPSDNTISMMMFWFIEKQKFLEALDEHDIVKAVAIFGKDIKPWWESDTDKHQDLAKLLIMKNYREDEAYADCGDIPNMRAHLVSTLKSQLRNNKIFHQKLDFPMITSSRLDKVVAQSGQWQHFLCGNDMRHPTTNTANYNCERSSASTSNQHLKEAVPVTNARVNGAELFSSPLASMDFTGLFQK